MTLAPTPASAAPASPVAHEAPHPRAILRELAAFLRRPTVMEPAGLRTGGAWRALAVLTALHVAALLLVVLPLISWWQGAFGLPMPDAFGKVPSGWLLPLTVGIAPVLEEMLFRGWQTGRPRALWLLACVVVVAVLLALSTRGMSPVVAGASMLAVVVMAAPGGWWWLRRQPTPHVYLGAFQVVFWIAAAIFAGFHLMNYPSISWLALPMVLPQLWGAVILGFSRQRLGLAAAIIEHACANATVMMLAHLTG